MLHALLLTGEMVRAFGRCCHVRPQSQQMTVFKREVEKGRQHLRRQFNRHMVNPINRFTFRKGIQHIGCALPNQIAKTVQCGR